VAEEAEKVHWNRPEPFAGTEIAVRHICTFLLFELRIKSGTTVFSRCLSTSRAPLPHHPHAIMRRSGLACSDSCRAMLGAGKSLAQPPVESRESRHTWKSFLPRWILPPLFCQPWKSASHPGHKVLHVPDVWSAFEPSRRCDTQIVVTSLIPIQEIRMLN
jgi:hypothetical protein